jgi:hypothetical protein
MPSNNDPSSNADVWSYQALLKELVTHNSRTGVDLRSERDRWRKRIGYAVQTGRLKTVSPSKSPADARFAAKDVELWARREKLTLGTRRQVTSSEEIGSTARIRSEMSSIVIPAPDRLPEAYRKLAEENERLRAEVARMRPYYEAELARREKIARKQKQP